MKKTTILAVVLGVLVLISVVQAFQLGSLKTTLAEGNVKLGSTSSRVTPQASSGGVPSNIDNLPTMVGGC